MSKSMYNGKDIKVGLRAPWRQTKPGSVTHHVQKPTLSFKGAVSPRRGVLERRNSVARLIK